jgi:DNA polymerase gamma 1
MLEMGTTYLPINDNWIKYMNNSEKVFRESEKEVKTILMQKANEALELMKEDT